jgi:hypothetical protein
MNFNFQCSNCKVTFSRKHHLTNHLNRKKKCISVDVQGKVFTLTINGNHYEVSTEDELTNKIIELIGKSNIKKLSVPIETKEQEKPFIIPLTDGKVDNRTEFEKQIDLDTKRQEYIDKIKKYFHKRALGIAKDPFNRTNPEFSLKMLNDKSSWYSERPV